MPHAEIFAYSMGEYVVMERIADGFITFSDFYQRANKERDYERMLDNLVTFGKKTWRLTLSATFTRISWSTIASPKNGSSSTGRTITRSGLGMLSFKNIATRHQFECFSPLSTEI